MHFRSTHSVIAVINAYLMNYMSCVALVHTHSIRVHRFAWKCSVGACTLWVDATICCDIIELMNASCCLNFEWHFICSQWISVLASSRVGHSRRPPCVCVFVCEIRFAVRKMKVAVGNLWLEEHFLFCASLKFDLAFFTPFSDTFYVSNQKKFK